VSARFLKPPAAQNTADAKFGEGRRFFWQSRFGTARRTFALPLALASTSDFAD
jgi:hypothetical protein